MLHPSLLYNRGHKDVLLTPSATSAPLCQPCLILSRWKLAIQLFIHMQILIGPTYCTCTLDGASPRTLVHCYFIRVCSALHIIRTSFLTSNEVAKRRLQECRVLHPPRVPTGVVAAAQTAGGLARLASPDACSAAISALQERASLLGPGGAPLLVPDLPFSSPFSSTTRAQSTYCSLI